jgi:D-alanyl-D-alanine carboxypeptidase
VATMLARHVAGSVTAFVERLTLPLISQTS